MVHLTKRIITLEIPRENLQALFWNKFIIIIIRTILLLNWKFVENNTLNLYLTPSSLSRETKVLSLH